MILDRSDQKLLSLGFIVDSKARRIVYDGVTHQIPALARHAGLMRFDIVRTYTVGDHTPPYHVPQRITGVLETRIGLLAQSGATLAHMYFDLRLGASLGVPLPDDEDEPRIWCEIPGVEAGDDIRTKSATRGLLEHKIRALQCLLNQVERI